MLFSVIIPTFNRSALLRKALDSVFAQQFGDFEVIVVDDGSTDETATVVHSFGRPIQLLSQDNKGVGAARNLGAQYARGDYVAFLDSDDVWFPWTLATFAALIVEYGKPAILAAKLIEFSEESELVSVRPERPQALLFTDYYSSHGKGYFVGGGMSVLHRSLLLDSGGFTDRRINAEDHDLILRMGATPGFVQVLEPVTLAWRRHASSATKNVWRTLEGMRFLLEQERRGCYPGGLSRARERRRILTRHIRPITLECLRQGLRDDAWKLYRETFEWHVRLGRWKYLLGFPIKASVSRQ